MDRYRDGYRHGGRVVDPSAHLRGQRLRRKRGGGVEQIVPIEPSPTPSGQVPTLRWPLGFANHDSVFVQLYPDRDLANGTWRDFRCNIPFTYDGHRGTDIMAHNFRVMDQGVPVVAAAAGRVTWTQRGYFDRNYWPPYVGLPNGINIRHPDGSDSQYFHLRQHSVAVEVGDEVEAGQIIAYIGSSGQSPTPHLHFEVWENGQSRDPSNGPCNAAPSLWESTFDYPGDTDLTVLDWDLFLDINLAGNEQNNYFGDKRLKNRPFRPDTVASDVSQIGVWVELQGLAGSFYTIRIIDNEGNEFARRLKGVSSSRSVQWHALYWDFAASLDALASPEGAWTIELVREGQPVRQKTFEVGARTVFPVRFFPLAGRSFRHRGIEIRDSLRVAHAAGEVEFALFDAPPGVRLEGGQLIITATPGFSHRNGNFKVAVTDEAGQADTMYYHVVSPQLPLLGVATATEEQIVPSALERLQNYPNPFRQKTTISFSTLQPGYVALNVYDLMGRRVERRAVGYRVAGTHVIDFDAGHLASGIYLYQLSTPDGAVTKRMTIVR